MAKSSTSCPAATSSSRVPRATVSAPAWGNRNLLTTRTRTPGRAPPLELPEHEVVHAGQVGGQAGGGEGAGQHALVAVPARPPPVVDVRAERRPVEAPVDAVALAQGEEHGRGALDRRAADQVLAVAPPLPHGLAGLRVDEAEQQVADARPERGRVVAQLDAPVAVAS